MTLYLTKTELALYQNLPDKLRKQWDGAVEEETERVNETEEELIERADLVRSSLKPEQKSAMQRYVEKMSRNADSMTSDDVPADIFPAMLFMIGATGMGMIVENKLKDTSSVEELKAVATVCEARHAMLTSHSGVSHS